MALTKTFPGQITDFVASEVIPSLSTVTAPLTAITTDFSPEANRGQGAIITTAIEAGNGRVMQTLDRATDTYTPEFQENSPAINQKKVEIHPDFIVGESVDVPTAEFSFLKNPSYIRDKIKPAIVDATLKQVLAKFYGETDPFKFADNDGSTESGNDLAIQLRGRQLGFDQFDVKNLSSLETDLFNLQIPVEDGLNLIHVSDLDIAQGSDEINWNNYTGGTEGLRNKMYGVIKNTALHRAHFVDANGAVQKDGLSLTEPTAGAFTIPVPAGQTGKSLSTGGSLTYKQVPDHEGSGAAFANTQKLVGILLHKRAISMAAWPQFSSDELTGMAFGNAQTAMFVDPLSGLPMRLLFYYKPDEEKYVMRCSCKFGITQSDPRAATFVYKTT